MNLKSSHVLPSDRRIEAAGSAHPRSASRAHWLDSRRLSLYSLAALACYAVFLAVYLYRVLWQQRADFPPLAMDFLPFWSASFLAQHGHAVDAYNLQALTDVEMSAAPYFRTMGSILPWLYPPNSLLIMRRWRSYRFRRPPSPSLPARSRCSPKPFTRSCRAGRPCSSHWPSPVLHWSR